jgi:hypothetical protein
MGYVKHDAVIVTVSGYVYDSHYRDTMDPKVEEWRGTLPAEWQALVVGPIRGIVNGDVTWFFAPDGSKEGWDTSDLGDSLREQFIGLFQFAYDDGSSPFDVVAVTFGSDFRYDFAEPKARYADARSTV